MVSYQDIAESVEPLGLCLRGGFVDGQTYILVGNVGSRLWENFGPAYDDWVEPDPLDAWTKRHMDDLAQKLGAEVVYPFDGPPFAPFQTWALRADTVFQSPIGALIHPEYGLWHAYRAALIFEEAVPGLPRKDDAQRSPCEKCDLKPCLYSCPAEAFRMNDFRYQNCLDFLNKNLEGSCMHRGCLARRACPVGADYRYEPEHARFHMGKFLTAIFKPPGGKD